MQEFYAKEVPYTIIKSNDVSVPPFPYLRDSSGNRTMICVSPHHGRSYIVSKKDGRYIVSKGNGLSYTHRVFVGGSSGNMKEILKAELKFMIWELRLISCNMSSSLKTKYC